MERAFVLSVSRVLRYLYFVVGVCAVERVEQCRIRVAAVVTASARVSSG